MIYIGADHAGFVLKESIKKYLDEHSVNYEDVGADTIKPDDDYSDYAKVVAQKVAADPEHRGILVCGSGQGICIAANKFPNIRAAQAWNSELARAGRNDDDINILCLSGRFTDESTAISIVESFLNTPFEKVERRVRRIKEISELDVKN